ncbi:MAG: hypothetical protein M3Z16_03415 [Pseudomonadota bacterium]|nr:hypothetical protein [Pseudomonadota bacterium]
MPIQLSMQEDVDLQISCPCGCENFNRIVVERIKGRPVVTDLVACVECRSVFHVPLPPPLPIINPGFTNTEPPDVEVTSLLATYGSHSSHEGPKLLASERAALMESVRRANKSKKRR